jgi:hypothetical protein
MQKIINSEIDKVIDTKKLGRLVPDYCRVVRYDRLKGKTLQQVMGRYTCLIVLWNIHDKQKRTLNQPGHFFVLSTRGPESCVVFSSTGMSPSKELFVTQSDPGLFERILPKDTVYNKIKLQGNRSSNTCWRWCLAFIHFAPMGLKAFQNLFAKPSLHLNRPDEMVTAMTLMSLY